MHLYSLCFPSLFFIHYSLKVFANNGFIFNDSSLDNFADASCSGRAYMRRHIVIWGDCVKLNYGDRPEHCPALWQRMSAYVEQSASVFHGLRVDNCHSTPLPVLQHMAAVARAQRPNIILIGELFTGCNQKDIDFVRACGLNLLIRDAIFKYAQLAPATCASRSVTAAPTSSASAAVWSTTAAPRSPHILTLLAREICLFIGELTSPRC